MTRLQYRTKVDLGVALVTTAVGAFFTYHVSLIEAVSEDAIGPRMIPYFLSITMMVLGGFVGLTALLRNDPALADEPAPQPVLTGDSFGFRDSDIAKMVAVVAMGAVYIWLFYAIGYVLSTAVSLALMLVVFGNRNVKTVVVLSIVGALAYDYLFMNLMGLYDPPGEYFDLQEFLD